MNKIKLTLLLALLIAAVVLTFVFVNTGSLIQSVKFLHIIEYQGHQVPLDQVILVSEPMGCPFPHWHTRQQSATALDGTIVTEPKDGLCGLGTHSQLPIKSIAVE